MISLKRQFNQVSERKIDQKNFIKDVFERLPTWCYAAAYSEMIAKQADTVDIARSILKRFDVIRLKQRQHRQPQQTRIQKPNPPLPERAQPTQFNRSDPRDCSTSTKPLDTKTLVRMSTRSNGNNYATDRRPPAPCRICGGDHWNRDCPRRISMNQPPSHTIASLPGFSSAHLGTRE